MANQWFRMYHEFATDPKVQMLSEGDQRRFVMLLCIRCSKTDELITDDEVAFYLRVSSQEVLETKKILLGAGFIDEYWALTVPLENGTLRPPSHVWREIREIVFKRNDYTCQYCGPIGVKLECDHVVPVSKGGCHDYSNLATACFSCNRSKRDKTLEEWGAV